MEIIHHASSSHQYKYPIDDIQTLHATWAGICGNNAHVRCAIGLSARCGDRIPQYQVQIQYAEVGYNRAWMTPYPRKFIHSKHYTSLR